MTEHTRLDEDRERKQHWKRWGPYLAQRAWGTVREDYSAAGTPWEYFPHDHARSRAYRWNEDGLLGFCDRHQRICFAVALWNERDPILKERLFGLTGHQGNHGEDVKEYYFFVDNTPTHAYMRALYKYPQAAFPYEALVEENARRDRRAPEFELLDTGVFDGDRYFDVTVEYAKVDPEDILIAITVVNRGPEAAPVHVLPTIWFRNTWSWNGSPEKPHLAATETPHGTAIALDDAYYGRRWLYCDGQPELMFAENETNTRRLFGTAGAPYPKDAINDAVVGRNPALVNPGRQGTKAAACYVRTLQPGETAVFRLRFSDKPAERLPRGPFDGFETTIAQRRQEADAFYATVIPRERCADGRAVMRQALAGLLWSKQFYNYVVRDWLEGDPAEPTPPASRWSGRNHEWTHLYNADVIAMPDTWEYPWYASWDLAFHCVALALVDSDYAKQQLVLLLREWYLHPNGQLPAYEWKLSDVNPPVHAWAAWRVYKIEQKRRGTGDRIFLERVFHKLLINFTWWVNRKDAEGRNIFQGGFLGLDNIGLFDRSAPLPMGGQLEQSDATSWMAMYCLNMLAIALELSYQDVAYEDVASKFWEHFLGIAHAMRHRGGHDTTIDLWDEGDRFFYDVLSLPDGRRLPIRVRSLVGLLPLLAVETLEPVHLRRLHGFRRRLDWFIEHRPDLTSGVASMSAPGQNERRLMAVVDEQRLRDVLRVMLDEREFFSPYGIRSLSRYHAEHPYEVHLDGTTYRVDYEPAEATSGLFGGNSNWRGPVWVPVNFLLIEALQKYHHYFGERFTIECPTGSGHEMTLDKVAAEISRRVTRLFLRDGQGRRPAYGGVEVMQANPHWRDLVLFHEYFHGDNGAGLGATHQTGWTALVAKLLQQSGE